MPTRIDSLTEEQKAQMPAWRDKWIAIGLSCEPADRKNFEENAKICYEAAGLTPPKEFVWVDSPYAGKKLAPVLAYEREHGKKPENPEEVINKGWLDYIGGQFWAGWQAYVTFLTDVCGLDLGADLNRRVKAYAETAKSAGWWWPYKDVVVVCERPRHIDRDAAGRLHSETRKAIEFRDGTGVYAWHGVRVPAYVIEHPEEITAEKIDRESNAEVRRVMLERFGFQNYFKSKDATEVHSDLDSMGRPRRLMRVDVPGDDPMMMVEVTNSSPEPDGVYKKYLIPVHHELRPLTSRIEAEEGQKLTCHNAVASTFGLRGEQYNPVIET